MNIVVTGGAGFIGSNFIHYVLAKHPEYNIINLDALTYAGNPENLADVARNSHYGFVQGNIADAAVVDRLIAKKPDMIINFAAESHVDRSINGPGEFIATNIVGTHVLLEAARKYGVKFLQISTDEVYGSIDEGAFKESDGLTPSSVYSASKASADLLVMAYHTTYGLDTLITRSSNNFGPYQYPEKLIPLFTTHLIEGKKVPLYGTGKNIRDWTYVWDNCAAIDLVVHKGKSGEIYNIAANNERENTQIAKALLDILGKDEQSIEHVTDRPGHDKRYGVDASKIRALGWKPRYSFMEALKETVAWYQQNPTWWTNVQIKTKDL